MVPVVVKPAETSRERKAFLQLPWLINAAYPNWVPPLRQDQKEMVNYIHHPFYDDAEIQTFVAWQSDQPVGRVAAIVNHAHNRQHNDTIGFFGFFEAIDDMDVARGLFDAARDWLRARGRTAIRGPVNPSLNHTCGLLIEGFNIPPTFMMTHNPPYYQRLIENYGFAKVEDLAAFWAHTDMLDSLDGKIKLMVAEIKKRFDVKLRRLDRSRYDEEVRLFLNLYNQSLIGTWGFSPMSDAEVAHSAASLKYLIVPEMTAIVEVDGKPVGSSFAMLDYNPRIKQIDGRLFPFGFFKLLYNKKAIKRIRVISTNVLPEYQKWGLGLVVLAHLLPSVLEWGANEAEFSWVLESNHLSFKSLKRGGAKIVKNYRLFDLPIGEGEPAAAVPAPGASAKIETSK
ncbi:N-acetyltransferase [Anatilimnocola sp. NA78]|uniref:N-acetyltransferase n=1 Tax=Anatilimnocola sp. NA78 TaxID=3415683 RepID=UPI003CE4506F